MTQAVYYGIVQDGEGVALTEQAKKALVPLRGCPSILTPKVKENPMF